MTLSDTIKYLFICYNFGRHQDAAKKYTFKQTQARVKRMRRLRLRRLVSYILIRMLL